MKIINNSISYDEGSININGNVNAMINLNSGLDRRMTGAQNIHHMINLLNPHGKILQLSITQFILSGLKDFINNPVSTYSSGMSARLGFSILTHTKPDLLLIDEIF